ncbi:2-C-methyl-D-erythritol 4-phosphate cytidylyltransferase [Ginsengibacter hankyongi]|uniref:2-C-methyl-D-erythritol 4-phosphate cytidylyltransferase n=1 Tax=Ginsengibacter hankyongi TaxID=2607284 RepID=A0A5J5II73_9BACT|nr:2-C-methyl-D-erythritol 4-phosphate cytidylyltransferase [Ginsengibacter hankyongi]KAA9039278.1 2-C-methyl-D-erythritol 4-phosphate cytidylyltransferase [Ginsengibacter hankyongi]
MKRIALIVAGGKGSRMNNDIPKQFLLLKDKPVLYYTLKAFTDAYNDIEIILVLPEEHIGKGQEIIDGYFDHSRIRITAGGRTRFHSVQNGLALINEESIIFVHDGVRCLVSATLIRKCYEAAVENGTAVPAIDCNDSIRLLTTNGNKILDRNKVKIIQTPQTFHSKILMPAYKIDYKDKFTDEASVVDAYGLTINLIEGEKYNIKITTPADLFFAEYLLESKSIDV